MIPIELVVWNGVIFLEDGEIVDSTLVHIHVPSMHTRTLRVQSYFTYLIAQIRYIAHNSLTTQ